MKNVFFPGSTKTEEASAAYYCDADVFVFPSFYDTWGLVVNEALSSGLYTLSSTRTGVTPDLIEAAPHDVGRAFDPDDQNAFAQLLQDTLARWPITPRKTIQAWGMQHTPEKLSDKIVEALLLAQKKRDNPCES